MFDLVAECDEVIKEENHCQSGGCQNHAWTELDRRAHLLQPDCNTPCSACAAEMSLPAVHQVSEGTYCANSSPVLYTNGLELILLQPACEPLPRECGERRGTFEEQKEERTQT